MTNETVKGFKDYSEEDAQKRAEIKKVLVETFGNYGFEHIETIIRNIPNKRMPSKNSPTNRVGKIDTTMNNEYIVVMRKV